MTLAIEKPGGSYPRGNTAQKAKYAAKLHQVRSRHWADLVALHEELLHLTTQLNPGDSGSVAAKEKHARLKMFLSHVKKAMKALQIIPDAEPQLNEASVDRLASHISGVLLPIKVRLEALREAMASETLNLAMIGDQDATGGLMAPDLPGGAPPGPADSSMGFGQGVAAGGGAGSPQLSVSAAPMAMAPMPLPISKVDSVVSLSELVEAADAAADVTNYEGLAGGDGLGVPAAASPASVARVAGGEGPACKRRRVEEGEGGGAGSAGAEGGAEGALPAKKEEGEKAAALPFNLQPREVRYQCALCGEQYNGKANFNPWWALRSEECPHCKKSQIPRVDISNPTNAIDYHPALTAAAEAMNSAQDGDDKNSDEHTDNEVDDLDEFKLSPAQSSKLLVLICHARTCPGRHRSRRHAEVCKSIKYLMLHIRDCSGRLPTGQPCPFPWCRPCKALLSHLVKCWEPNQCAICNPWNLPRSLQELKVLNQLREQVHSVSS